MHNTNNKIEKIWEQFSKSLRLFIQQKISEEAAVDDILQDIFIKIHAKLDSLSDKTKLNSWIYRIARNTIIDYYRKNKTMDKETTTDPFKFNNIRKPDCEKKFHDDTPESQVAAGLKGMIKELPEKYAQALLSVEFEGITQKELAKRLGISVSGAKSQVQRARHMLRDKLMQCCHFEFDRYGTIIGMYPAGCCCCQKEAVNSDEKAASFLLKRRLK